MIHKIFLIGLVISWNSVLSQSNSMEKNDEIETYTCGRHVIGGGFGKFALYYLNYEYKVHALNWTQTSFGAGYGGAHGDSEGGLPSYHHFSISANQYFGWRPIYFGLSFLPTLNFFGKVTYLELNGRVGLKYEFKKCENPITIEIGRVIRLYRTYKNDVAPPYYVGFAINL